MLKFLKKHKKIAVNAVLFACVALSLFWGISNYKAKLKLSYELELAQNNIEAYLGALNGSLLACNVLKLDVSKLAQYNDKLLQQIDSVRKVNKIKTSGLNTAATQKLTYDVNASMGVRGDIIEILKDTIYTDSLKYNDLTTVSYSIGKDSVNIRLKVENTQYLFIYSTKLYKNKKSFIKRLFTLDFKKVYRYKYNIVNTNDLLNISDVRVVETNK